MAQQFPKTPRQGTEGLGLEHGPHDRPLQALGAQLWSSALGAWSPGKGGPREGRQVRESHGVRAAHGRGSPTCAGVPVLGQLVALAAVALVGAVDVGALLAAAPGLALVHICRAAGAGGEAGVGSPGASSLETVSSHVLGASGEPEARRRTGSQSGARGGAGAAPSGVVTGQVSAWGPGAAPTRLWGCGHLGADTGLHKGCQVPAMGRTWGHTHEPDRQVPKSGRSRAHTEEHRGKVTSKSNNHYVKSSREPGAVVPV